KQEFAEPGAYEPLRCEGRHCTNCGKCRDWYYTGDPQTWQWIRNVKNWTKDDWKRWDHGDYCERFQRRDGYTCTISSSPSSSGSPIIGPPPSGGPGGHPPSPPPSGGPGGHPPSPFGHPFGGYFGGFGYVSCLCEDNKRV
ncbi:unnamed protein product, partial [Rotaria sordida]